MNKKYHVYGIGNALTDIEYEVSPELLQELEIEKGVMTLIEEDHQNKIVEGLDGSPCKMSCGGSAANTVIALAQFGGKGFYSCKVANDETGSFYTEDLLRCEVDTNLQHHEPEEGITGKCLVLVTPDADRTMNTFLGITSNFSENELVPEAIADSQYLYIEGYLVPNPRGKEAAIKARNIAQEAGGKVAISLSDLNMVRAFKQQFLDIIGSGVDFIFSNESEALEMAGTEDISEAIEYFKTLSKGFAITLGAKGSVIFDGKNIIEIPAVKVNPIDTVGAGDMFAGAFLYGITHGMSFSEAGKLASQACARLITNFGARLEAEETRSLLQAV
ncbi:MAG: adenosine kinase [Cyanobacteria bacterium QH_9_48_43]|jgi:sugar/nucleoside kinase (ribokinase family)|nr:MAG: adenosine kinase [Cyanobacteria bacterium QH_10_48_56]PSO65616.1 MAG: adenosine kinase [Cyanobacteria bacterium QH_2_48_84]PSO69002.1 MAG: adenosine kinase [Cyanobacteria bacterium QS_1_48_34]PSO78300.1 MAG: adenosine kinase [Cyanobacteria bacterium QH_3_48_40]PSO79181.1 MAG: adenosine kinase [Cyanobacteria bacterium QS_4_48_99]PSO82563.1 MAG: adenosine kinase [Cyanobacteria bacterium QS_5_48_63]PSO83419.1 MAG: adenosine kinase [Cyanobacteria bacterium QH_9_48_43]PSO88968.1 MAG: aden